MSKQRNGAPTDDQGIEELLRQVGARDEPSSEVTNEVQQAVHAEWRAMLDERARRRRTFTYGVAASVAFAVVVASATLRFIVPDAGGVATIALIDGRVDGQVQFDAQDAAPHAHRVGDDVAAGETLRTDASSRVALDVGEDVSVRIDRNSIVQFAARDRLVLSDGAIYVDVHPGRQGHDDLVRDDLVIETRAGDVHHLGTQYQVRQTARTVEVSIREGRVEVANANGDALASAGEQLHIMSDGSMQRTSISPTDPLWQWAAQAAPVFEIDDQRLSAFLEWVARQTGRTIVYATRKAQNTAEAVRLRGSIAGLDPEAALTAVLSTTELTRYQTKDEFIGIALARTVDSTNADRPTP